jgi:hypothetical protein
MSSGMSEKGKNAWKDANKNKYDLLQSDADSFAAALGISSGKINDDGIVNPTESEFENYFNNLSTKTRDAITRAAIKVSKNTNNTDDTKKIIDSYIYKAVGPEEAQAFLLNQDWDSMDFFNDEGNILK